MNEFENPNHNNNNYDDVNSSENYEEASVAEAHSSESAEPQEFTESNSDAARDNCEESRQNSGEHSEQTSDSGTPFNQSPYTNTASQPNFSPYENPYNMNGYGQPILRPVGYTPIKPKKEHKAMSKGLKVFCIILAAFIALTGTTLAGYLCGKGSVSVNRAGLYSKVNIDLSEKPKDTDELTAGEVYAKVNESIVGICTYNSNGEGSNATGVIYTEDGYIVTNDHIYSNVSAPKFRIYTFDGKEYTAEYVAGDSISDLAVLKITDGKDFKPAEFGNSDELFCGESVVALGRPSGASDSTSITKGIVSMTERRVSITSNYSSRMIQTDSAINPGSSGGALVNMYAQVIGITSSKQSGTDYDAVGFAIPTTTMKRVVTQLIANGKVTDRAKLGITYTEMNSVSAEINNANAVGIYVASVSEDSDLYGKVGEGDIITQINGIDIINDDIVLDIIENSKAGDTITVTVVDKNGSVSSYTAKLGVNTGESSYNEKLEAGSDNAGDSSGSGTFDFPFGE